VKVKWIFRGNDDADAVRLANVAALDLDAGSRPHL
jgi:hypothetical protein